MDPFVGTLVVVTFVGELHTGVGVLFLAAVGTVPLTAENQDLNFEVAVHSTEVVVQDTEPVHDSTAVVVHTLAQVHCSDLAAAGIVAAVAGSAVAAIAVAGIAVAGIAVAAISLAGFVVVAIALAGTDVADVASAGSGVVVVGVAVHGN